MVGFFCYHGNSQSTEASHANYIKYDALILSLCLEASYFCSLYEPRCEKTGLRDF